CDRTLDEAVCELLELRAAEGTYQVLGNAVHWHDVRQVDLRGGGGAKLNLGLLGSILQALKGHRVLAQVNTFVVLELICQPVDDNLVEVIATQVGIAVGALHFEDAIAQLKYAN